MKKIWIISLVIIMVLVSGCNTANVFPKGKTMNVGDGRQMQTAVEVSF